MKLIEYIRSAMRTEPSEEQYAECSKRSNENDMIRLDHAILGLTTELGELADVRKKHIFAGKPVDWINVGEEIGDLMWYLAILFDFLHKKTGIDCYSVLETNRAKLLVRHPDKFKEQEALFRNTDKERKVLEGRCEECDQIDVGQTGECPCVKCGLPTAWDSKEKMTPEYYAEMQRVNPYTVGPE